VPFDDIDLQIGDTDLPFATVAGGSAGMTDWGSTVTAAAQAFREQHGRTPAPGAEARGEMPDDQSADYAKYAFGAHFVEVRVHADTGEVRVPRMLGVFAAGRILNPATGRSQLLGGMTMGIGMALHEQGVTDPRFGHVVNHDFAEYHIPASADVVDLEAVALEEHDPYTNQMGSKGIGEIGIVGAAAAIANGAFHATGIRVRDLPLTPDKFLRG
jgi:xanthine dehydrogenase YagR molybdenum-binding subunit